MAKIELVNISKELDASELQHYNLLSDLFRRSRREIINAVNLKDGKFSIENLNLTIPDGKSMVIVGPTGCGKTTLLRIIAGLISPDSGEVRYGGVNMNEVHPKDRGIGMVFQNYALYPHFKSRENLLSYFLFRKKTPELVKEAGEKYQKTSELLGVDLAYLMDRMPRNLSGGEKQRVAIGRCITRDPSLFLLDEPFSNLDQKLREKYRLNLKILLNNFNITTVYVTHDQSEASIIADMITIMSSGKIEQVGTFNDLYNNPGNMFVAEFLNLYQETQAINFINGEVFFNRPGETIIGIRPEDIEIKERKSKSRIEGNIIDSRNAPLKRKIVLTINIGNEIIYAMVPSDKDLILEGPVYLEFKKYLCFDKKTGQRIK